MCLYIMPWIVCLFSTCEVFLQQSRKGSFFSTCELREPFQFAHLQSHYICGQFLFFFRIICGQFLASQLRKAKITPHWALKIQRGYLGQLGWRAKWYGARCNSTIISLGLIWLNSVRFPGQILLGPNCGSADSCYAIRATPPKDGQRIADIWFIRYLYPLNHQYGLAERHVRHAPVKKRERKVHFAP